MTSALPSLKATGSLIMQMSKGSYRDDAKGRGCDPSTWLGEHGDVLFRFAMARVRKREVAEDLVQDTFVAAVRAYDSFGNRSSVRSWLVGILRYKIIDYYRKRHREKPFSDLNFLRDEFSEKFDADGYWDHELGPKEWTPPSDEVMHREEFWQVLRDCMAKLPPRIADVFRLRVMDEFDGKEVCASLGISESNLWVMLHRARLALRECFERNWFGRTNEEDPE
jgi:RNA polymerase sigma-70 factor (ECF subfamily)